MRRYFVQPRIWSGLALVISGLLLFSSTGWAQAGAAEKSPPRPVSQIEEEIQQLRALLQQQQQQLEQQQRQLDQQAALVHQLQQRLAALQPSSAAGLTERPASPEASGASVALSRAAAPASPSGPGVLQAGWTNGRPFIRSSDGELEARFFGYAQFDFRGYGAGNTPANTFLIRRARLAMEGTLYRHYEFKLEGDFADRTSTLLRDGFININYVPGVQFQFGQFKQPFSQEELTSSSRLDFVERSMVNNLAPSRSPGVQVHGKLAQGRFEYQLGAFNGKGLLAENTTRTPEGVVRLRFSPWKPTHQFWLRGLALGGAFADGRARGGLSVRGRTESQSVVFFPPEPVNGEIVRANGELTWLLGPAAIRAEYVQTNQARDGLGPAGTNLPGVVAKGYMIQGTYLLTGESKPEAALVKPKRAFLGRGGEAGAGAWELKFRYSNLQLSDSVRSNRAETFSTGINWYLSPYVRYILDLNVERFKDPLRSPTPLDRGAFFTLLTRMQFYF